MNAAWLNSQPLNTYGAGEVQLLEGAAGLAATASANAPELALVQAVSSTANTAVATATCTLVHRRGLAVNLTAVALSPSAQNTFVVSRALSSSSSQALANGVLFGSFTINLAADVQAAATGDLIPGRIDLESDVATAIAVSGDATLFARRQFSRNAEVNAVSQHVGDIAITGNLFATATARATQVNTYKVNSTVIMSVTGEAGAAVSLAQIWASVPMEAELAFVTSGQSSFIGRYRTLDSTVTAGVDLFASSAALIRTAPLGAVVLAAAAQVSSLIRSQASMAAISGAGATHASVELRARAQHAAVANAAASSVATPVYSGALAAIVSCGVEVVASVDIAERLESSVAAMAVDTRPVLRGTPGLIAGVAVAVATPSADLTVYRWTPMDGDGHASASGAVDLTILEWRPFVSSAVDALASAESADLAIIAKMGAIAAAVAEQLAILFTNIENEAPIARTISVLPEGDPIIVAQQDTGIIVYGD